jgi:hypothetical protein
MKKEKKTWPKPEPSPWNLLDITSPDGKKKIEYSNVGEIRMGAPHSGDCFIVIPESNIRQLISRDAGGPAIWSDDSLYVALPIWTSALDQKLGIFEVSSLKLKLSMSTYSLIYLKRFSNGKIEGTSGGADGQPFVIELKCFFQIY